LLAAPGRYRGQEAEQGRASTTTDSGVVTVASAAGSRNHQVMRTNAVAQDDIRIVTGDNRLMTLAAPTAARGGVLRRILCAPFSRRTCAELGYSIVSFPLGVSGFVVTFMSFFHPVLLFACTPIARAFGSANRAVAGELLGEQVAAPPPMRTNPHLHVKTPQPARVVGLVTAAGGRVKKQNESKLKVTGLTASELAAAAAREQVVIEELKTHSGWLEAAARDVPAWRARAYLLLKLPVSVAMLGVVAIFWLGGLALMTGHVVSLRQHALAYLLIPVGAAAVLAGPWLTHAITSADRRLIRALLGPTSLSQRVRDLEHTRARAVDDSAARLRSIERDLHDGAQAQLVGLAMKLGLAREKLDPGAGGVAPADLDRAVELVDAAHRSAIDAITELRVLARGIHPPVLDNGLPDALTTLAARSAVPVELITDIPERPSAAIETIAYFCAAELVANVAKHSGARHATLEAVHVPGLLRIRVTDDGHGGARPENGGGLRGLAERIGTVDGRMEMSSPHGGPTVVTVELPSHA
jgi:signal transduction histidine kinase